MHLLVLPELFNSEKFNFSRRKFLSEMVRELMAAGTGYVLLDSLCWKDNGLLVALVLYDGWLHSLCRGNCNNI